jgi:hypothetical protein
VSAGRSRRWRSNAVPPVPRWFSLIVIVVNVLPIVFLDVPWYAATALVLLAAVIALTELSRLRFWMRNEEYLQAATAFSANLHGMEPGQHYHTYSSDCWRRYDLKLHRRRWHIAVHIEREQNLQQRDRHSASVATFHIYALTDREPRVVRRTEVCTVWPDGSYEAILPEVAARALRWRAARAVNRAGLYDLSPAELWSAAEQMSSASRFRPATDED